MDKELLDKLLQDFDAIQMPRTPYVLKDLVVDTKHTPEQRWAQMVLELSIAYDNLRTAKCNARIKEIEIEGMPESTEKEKLEKEIKQIELEQLNRARLGATREFEFLYNIWLQGEKHYSREELNLAQPKEFEMMLKTQALHDFLATGSISQSNLEGLRQIGIEPVKFLEDMQHSLPQTVLERDEIEQRFLEEGKLRALRIIPTEKPAINGFPNLNIEVLELPTNVEIKKMNIHGRPVADAYNYGFEQAIKEGCTHVITTEDDQQVEPDTLIRLFNFALDNPDCAVGAWYPKRQETREGVHIHLDGVHRRFMNDDGKVHECKTMAMGMSIYPIEILKKIGYPRCKTTENLTQDSYLTQKIRDAGYKCLVDTNIKIGHKDRTTGKIYY